MEKEKIVLFFCDILGTISEIKEDQVEILKEQLELKRKQCGADKLVISLVTSDSEQEYLIKWAKFVKNRLSTENIIMGDHYGEMFALINDKIYGLKNTNDQEIIIEKDPDIGIEIPIGSYKADKICFYTYKTISKNNVVKVIYADDTLNPGPYDYLSEIFADAKISVDFFTFKPYYQSAENYPNMFISDFSNEKDISGLIDCFRMSNNQNVIFSDNEIEKENKINI